MDEHPHDPGHHDGHAHDAHMHDGHAEHNHGGHAEHDHEGHAGHAGHGHGGHDHGDHAAQFRRMFWISLALAIPVVFFSPMFAHLLGYTPPGSPWTEWIPPVLGTIVYAWAGWPFLAGAVAELRARRPGMMLLIGLATTVAFLASWGATLGLLPHDLDFWWETALLVVIMLLGHWVEMAAVARTGSALDRLAALLPDTAERVTSEGTETVAPAELRVGDLVAVRPGSRVPADGRVVEGEASVDESMLTGESRPVLRQPGDAVVAGSVSTDSALRVQVARVGEDTALAGIQRLVAQAQNSTTRIQRLADRAAGWLFWFALGAAAITAATWLVVGTPESALARTITVLVIACPHALGLAIPLVVSIASGKAATAGILVTDRLALERMREVDTVLFDKTGTLTTGAPVVAALLPSGAATDVELLALAAAAEAQSEHPLARAIVRAAAEAGVSAPKATGFRSSPATGVSARVGDREVHVGGPRLLRDHGATALAVEPSLADSGTVVHVLAEDRSGDVRTIGAIVLRDEIRPSAAEAVAGLRARGVRVALVTGDAEPVARSVARELGIDDVRAEVRPEDKERVVAELQAGGAVVAMVGDGVNDAPALARADVGLAIGAGTDVAAATAGIVVADDDPRSVLSVIELSRASHRKMVQNLWWAAGYNLLAVPLAAGVLAPIGFDLPMSVGALLMSASTVVVALNAQLLRRLDLRRGR